MLCTVSQIKATLGLAESDTEHNAVLERIAAGVSAAFEGPEGAGRPLMQAARLVLLDAPDHGTRHLWLPAIPVIEISSIKEGAFGIFDGSAELDEGSDFVANYATGRLTRIGFWPIGDQCVRVEYVGGYGGLPAAWVSGHAYVKDDRVSYGGDVFTCTAAITGTTAPSSDVNHWEVLDGLWVPDDLVDAAIKQSIHEFNARRTPGVSGESVQGANVSMDPAGGLLPGVKAVLERYRRI